MRSCYQVTALLLLLLASCHPQPFIAQDGSVKTTYIHQYGVEVADEVEWKERGSSGQIIKQLKNGATQAECWLDGKLHGLCTLTFPHSSVIHIENFYDRGASVWQIVNYASGMPKRQDIYRPANDVVVSTWYEDGSPRSAEEFQGSNLISGDYFTRDQELETQVVQGHGERIRRDGHGQLIAKDEFEQGLRVLEVIYYPNGMPQKYIPYADNKIQGILKTFLAGGEPATIEAWQNNLQMGPTTLFRNGERIAVVPYVNGYKNGKELRYRPGTDLVTEEITWKDNLKHGPTVLFVDQKKFTEYYFQDQKVSRVEFTELDTKPR